MWRRGGRRAKRAIAAVWAIWLVGLIGLGMVGGTADASAHASAPRSCGASGASGAPASAPAAVGMTGASITLSRTKGPVGMSLSLSGTGWPAGVTIAVDEDAQLRDGTMHTLGRAPVSLVTGIDGTFQTDSFVIPDLQACEAGPLHDIYFVAHTPDNTVSAEAPFAYTPPPTLDSHSGQQVRPGFAVSLTGENWEPGEQVTITSGVLATPQLACAPQIPPACQQQATPVPSATVHATASDTGEISMNYSLPGGLAARSGVLVQATGTGPLYGTVTAAPLEFLILPAMDPTINLDKATGVAGAAVSVRGDHWYPGDTVQIEYCRDQNMTIGPGLGGGSGQGELRCDPQSAQTLGAVIVDASGRFSTTVSIPTDARIGPITIQARVPNDAFGLLIYAQAAAFQIVPPPLPWNRQHPRMALALAIARPAVPALILGVLLLAVYVWSRRRARAPAAGHAATAGGGKP